MKNVLSAIFFSFLIQISFGKKQDLSTIDSPNKKVKALVELDNRKVSLEVSKNRKLVIAKSPLGMIVNGVDIGEGSVLAGPIAVKTIDEKYPMYGNHSLAVNNCNEVSIPLKSGKISYQLIVRVYDDGLAVRYKFQNEQKIVINGDNTSFAVPDSDQSFWAYYSDDNENLHNHTLFSEIPEGKALLAPLTVKSGPFYLSFSEADCRDFPDLSWIRSGSLIKANFTTNPNGWTIESGEMSSPWRLAIIADNLTQLVNSDLIMNLCKAPYPGSDFSWVKPGRVLWQWWSIGSPKYEDQRHWFDAAKRLSWEYYLIDDGWRYWKQEGKDEWACLKDVIDYGNSVGVKTIVWVDSKEMRTVEGVRAYLNKVKNAGATGIKIDFIPPATPEIMQWYEVVREETYKCRLICDIHGCVKPTGLRRTWPHELTREGVRGNEYHMIRYNRLMPKNQDEIKPFTRLIAGPADFTPVILNENELRGYSWTHELAQAVVYLSPLTHFADKYQYYEESQAKDVLQDIPTVWDETIVLPCSEVGKIAAFARRKGNEWWIGILNGDQISTISFNLNFLKSSEAKATTFSDRQDALNAFIRESKIVYSTDEVKLKLQPGGGYFMRVQ